MWIRDAVQGDFFPSIDILSQGGYFPYRYGHAFWAFVAGTWGDEIVMDLFINIGQFGLEKGLLYTLGYNINTLSRMWREVSEKYYRSYMEGRDDDVGEVIFDTQNAGRVNIAPAVSPDGRFLAFFSEKDLLSIDLFIADATNKRIKRKISSLSRASHIDYISLLESAAAWSPDSKQLAIVTYSKGRNAITLINAERGNVEVSITLDSIKMMLHPSYSPDGRFLAFSGMNEGVSNIYILNLATQETRTLTHDKYAYMHPSWNATGKRIVVATDRMRYELEGNFNMAIIDVETGKIEDIPAFVGATNTNPIFDFNNGILFLSDRDGFRNLYKYDMLSQRIYLLTDLKTGISGITKYSQAITYSHTTSELFYTLYRNQQYTIYKSNLKNLKYILIENDAVDAYAGYLPPRVPLKEERVSKAVKELQKQYAPPKDSIKNVRYQPQFSLQTIQSTGFGLSANSGIGTTLTTGILLYFSDIIRNNDLYTVVSVNGEIYDIGAQVLYLNKKHRIDWGVRLGHIPLLTSGFTANNSSINGRRTRELNTNLIRTFIEQAYLTAYYPFSKALRLEASVGFNYYHYRIDQFKDIYVLNGNTFQFLGRNRQRLPAPTPLLVYQTSLAHVGDKGVYGFVGAPIDGYRYRIGMSQNLGEINFPQLLVDGRYYLRISPFTLAARTYYEGRYGDGGESERISPLNVAFPSLIHGYRFFDIYSANATLTNLIEDNSGLFAPNNYIGSQIAVGNAEIRLPFTGPKALALFPSNVLLTELNVFFDAGIAWSSRSYQQRLFGSDMTFTPTPIYSAGVGLRINLFGFFVIEPYYAVPFQRTDLGDRYGVFRVNLLPAW